MSGVSRFRGIARVLLSSPALLRRLPTRKFVFCYHDVSDPSDVQHSELYSTPARLFVAQMERLSNLFEWVPLGAITQRGRRGPRHLAALTFDDGFLSVKTVARPTLDSLNIPFAVFVCRLAAEENFLPVSTRHLIASRAKWRDGFGDLLAPSNRGYGFIQPALDEAVKARRHELRGAGLMADRLYLDPGEIQEMHRTGVTIGSHSVTHRVLSTTSPPELQDEIDGNHAFLGDLGIATSHFALPFGKREHYSQTVVETLHRSGYRAIYTTNPTHFDGANEGNGLVPRICVTNQSAEDLIFSMILTYLRKIDL